jgi:hypothetical protein
MLAKVAGLSLAASLMVCAVPDRAVAQPASAGTTVVERELSALAHLHGTGLLTPEEYRSKREAAMAGQRPDPSLVDRNGPFALRIGDTLVVRDADPFTGTPSGESTFVVAAYDATSVRFNGGAFVLDLDGNSLAPADTALLSGARLRHEMGGTPGQGRLTLTGAQAATVAMITLGQETLLLEGGPLRVARISVLGYPPQGYVPPGTPSFQVGSRIQGEVLVELTTGLVVAADIRSSNPVYNLQRSPLRLLRASTRSCASAEASC